MGSFALGTLHWGWNLGPLILSVSAQGAVPFNQDPARLHLSLPQL